MMSAPRSSWLAMALSGVKRCRLPSICERKVTPSGSSLRICARLNTWKPPESVSMGPGQPMKLCSPPKSAIKRVPGRR